MESKISSRKAQVQIFSLTLTFISQHQTFGIFVCFANISQMARDNGNITIAIK